MNSRKEWQLRGKKSTKEKSRRNILRLGALGAVAVLAANVLPGSDARATTDQAGTRSVAKQGAQKVLHAAPAGKSARKAAPVKVQGALAQRKPGSTVARISKQPATKAAAKVAKSPAGEREGGTKQTARVATKKAAKVMAQ